MQNFPSFSTARLVLSLPTISDLEDIVFHANSTSEIAENTITFPYPYEEKHAHFWLKMAEDGFAKKDAYIFAIREKENLKLILDDDLFLADKPLHKSSVYPFSLNKSGNIYRFKNVKFTRCDQKTKFKLKCFFDKWLFHPENSHFLVKDDLFKPLKIVSSSSKVAERMATILNDNSELAYHEYSKKQQNQIWEQYFVQYLKDKLDEPINSKSVEFCKYFRKANDIKNIAKENLFLFIKEGNMNDEIKITYKFDFGLNKLGRISKNTIERPRMNFSFILNCESTEKTPALFSLIELHSFRKSKRIVETQIAAEMLNILNDLAELAYVYSTSKTEHEDNSKARISLLPYLKDFLSQIEQKERIDSLRSERIKIEADREGWLMVSGD